MDLCEVGAFKDIFSTREDYCAWIGAQSTNSVHLKVGYGHVKTCLDPDFEVSMESFRRSTIEASEWGNFLSDIWSKGEKEISLRSQRRIEKRFMFTNYFSSSFYSCEACMFSDV